ncbi:MAG: Gfo/Idh/MocA family oxidoreductase, partial [Isosphaeraceae bacterium]
MTRTGLAVHRTSGSGLRIGLVGAGGVARYAHLPAYRYLGLTVTAICDVDEAVARDVAAEFGVEDVVSRPELLATRDDVDVLDIATPPSTRTSRPAGCIQSRLADRRSPRPVLSAHHGRGLPRRPFYSSQVQNRAAPGTASRVLG